ncbi:MAG: hypothetical protein LUF25_03360 [Phascolarctobacterium sp.]|nr:hypothetical protein [Phascolarctobacterium sp.]
MSFTAGSLDASRTDGRYLGYVWGGDSSISIKADTGSVTGAFWTTGDDDDHESTAVGTMELDLVTDTSWTITQDSKLTDLTLDDASALAFVSQGDGSWTRLYTNNLKSNDAGSSITMNINGGVRDESDHIYVMGEHT